jgi:hypothetical protein
MDANMSQNTKNELLKTLHHRYETAGTFGPLSL